MGDINGGGRPRTLVRHFNCAECPDTWRPWREGGYAMADKHALIEHGGEFRGDFEDRSRTQWATGDGRRLD